MILFHPLSARPGLSNLIVISSPGTLESGSSDQKLLLVKIKASQLLNINKNHRLTLMGVRLASYMVHTTSLQFPHLNSSSELSAWA